MSETQANVSGAEVVEKQSAEVDQPVVTSAGAQPDAAKDSNSQESKPSEEKPAAKKGSKKAAAPKKKKYQE